MQADFADFADLADLANLAEVHVQLYSVGRPTFFAAAAATNAATRA